MISKEQEEGLRWAVERIMMQKLWSNIDFDFVFQRMSIAQKLDAKSLALVADLLRGRSIITLSIADEQPSDFKFLYKIAVYILDADLCWTLFRRYTVATNMEVKPFKIVK